MHAVCGHLHDMQQSELFSQQNAALLCFKTATALSHLVTGTRPVLVALTGLGMKFEAVG
jgi:hypothetical protein